MSDYQYITLDGVRLAMSDLLAIINDVLSDGLGTLQLTPTAGSSLSSTAAGALQLGGAVAGNVGRIRLHDVASNPYLEYSVDGGQTWHPIQSEAISWVSGKAYSPNDAVLYDGAWYKCITATSASTAPSASVEWQLITSGSDIHYVHTMAQFKTALETANTDRITIVTYGELSGSLSATVQATDVVIYSAETTTLSTASLAIVSAADTNIWWHCSGMKLNPGYGNALSVSISGGHLWIEHAICITGSLLLGADVYYQYIVGTVSGQGEQRYWCQEDAATKYVPRNLSSLSSAAYTDSMRLYVDNGNAQYVQAGTMLEQVAAKAAKYFVINAQGPLADLPGSAPEGYVYYATDTGDVYVMGENAWRTPVHIQGPQGLPGSSGSSGAPGFSPLVSMSSSNGSTTITIIDADHPAGQTAVVFNGKDGVTPEFEIGTVETASASAEASVSLASYGSSYTFNFIIPRGEPGTAGEYTFMSPLSESSAAVSINQYPEIALEAVSDTLEVLPGHAYDLTGAAEPVSTLNLTLSSSAGKFGEAWIQVEFGASANITYASGTLTVVTAPKPLCTNLLHIVFVGGDARLYTVDYWSQTIPGFVPGDMTKAEYDPDNSGVVVAASYASSAASAGAVAWSGVAGRPDVNDPAITIYQGGVAVGSFTLNQSTPSSISLSAGGGGTGDMTKAEYDPDNDGVVTSASSASYAATAGIAESASSVSWDNITGKPAIGNAEIVVYQGGTRKGAFTVNQSESMSLYLDAGSGDPQVQADWDESDVDSPAYIQNKPTISDAEITVLQNGSSIGAFTLNQSSSQSISLTSGTNAPLSVLVPAAPELGERLKLVIQQYVSNSWQGVIDTDTDYNSVTVYNGTTFETLPATGFDLPHFGHMAVVALPANVTPGAQLRIKWGVVGDTTGTQDSDWSGTVWPVSPDNSIAGVYEKAANASDAIDSLTERFSDVTEETWTFHMANGDAIQKTVLVSNPSSSIAPVLVPVDFGSNTPTFVISGSSVTDCDGTYNFDVSIATYVNESNFSIWESGAGGFVASDPVGIDTYSLAGLYIGENPAGELGTFTLTIPAE